MPTKDVVIVASENGALRGGKAGGLGDVVRDLPKALGKLGWRISVISPAYGFLHRENTSKFRSRISFPFGGREEHGDFFEVTVEDHAQNVRYFVFEHPSVSGNPIYVNDPPNEPFKTDALKYALFCSAVGQFLKTIHRPYVLHLHDWHASTLLLLRELHPEFNHLKGIKTAFTIHNLAIQGTRPMRNHASSVESWFPELFVDSEWIHRWRDPRYEEPCYCPMAVGIQYADKVNTVSASYAKEILMPSTSLGFYAGEGLEV
ncbi:MAG TPA: glycogen/starch synthase, partial [Bacteroidota bacterium]|nr:glycogen/starch synthase [Bacteroidota bacterium]